MVELNRITSILTESYGIEEFDITEMHGYEGGIWKISTTDQTYILKRHTNDSQTKSILEAEDRAQKQLTHGFSYSAPQHITDKAGKFLVEKKDFIYRLLTFIPGTFLAETVHTFELAQSFGTCLGELDVLLSAVTPGSLAKRESSWDLQHLHLNYPYLKDIDDAKDRALVDYFYLQYEQHVLPYRYALRKQVIYNDANDWNVLCKDGNLSGIIDFGDICYSWLINELAVGLTYFLFDKEEPLKHAAEVLRAYHQKNPLHKLELDLLYFLIAGRLCMSLCSSAHHKKLHPASSYISISEEQARTLLRKWVSINPLKARETFYSACSYKWKRKKIKKRLEKERKQVLSKTLSISYTDPIHMYAAAFQYMYDYEGNTFLDAYNNIMLAGHTHPTVVRRATSQMFQLNTNTRYLYGDLSEYAQKLLEHFPDPLNRVLFVNSGSAATDLALRIACFHKKRKTIATLEEAYHGNTFLGLGISHYKFKSYPELKYEHCIPLPMPKTYVGQKDLRQRTGEEYAQEAIAKLESLKTELAAFIAEPIMGCGGQVPLAEGYLRTLYPFIRKYGGLCISDEVQVGFGRPGDTFWGFELHGVIPDIVILGKPIGNGHPLGAVVTTDEILGDFESGPEFFSSFGGNPVSCQVGLGVLQVIEEENLQTHAREVGRYLKAGLLKLKTQFECIGDVRGNGLFLGVELIDHQGFPNTQLAGRLKEGMRKNYILIGTDGPDNNVLKIKPPLAFNVDNAERLILQLERLILEYSNF